MLSDCYYYFRYVGRGPCASVATGSKASHTHEEENILNESFADIWHDNAVVIHTHVFLQYKPII